MDDANRKICHIKARPTLFNINSLIISLKKMNYEKIPKLESNNKESILYFCDEIIKTLKNPTNNHTNYAGHINHTYHTVFNEKKYLPSVKTQNNIKNEDNNDDGYEVDIEEDSDSEAEEKSNPDEVKSEVEIEELDDIGYEIYEEDENADFSD